MFGDDALKFLLSAGFEQGITITIKLIAELDAAFSIVAPTRRFNGSTLRECLLSEVLAVEMQKIEGVKDDAVGLRLSWRIEATQNQNGHRHPGQ